jgi:bifunctional non-homologous end joining protein LigD
LEVKGLGTLLRPSVVDLKPVSNHEKFDYPVEWVFLKSICNVRYTEITDDGLLRHPVYNGLTKTIILE